MKLSITQIILGVLTVLAACFIVGWMTYQAPNFLRQQKLGDGVVKTYIDVVPDHKALFDVSRYGSYFLPALGILLIVTGTVRAARNGARTWKLATVTITAGALVAALAYFITVYGYPTSFHTVAPDENDLMMRTFINPARPLVYTQSLTGFTCLLSLAIIGCGIAQLIKARKTTT
jgi:hypothetical protein